MKQVFEYWAKVYRPGYEIVSVRPAYSLTVPLAGGKYDMFTGPMEPMLSMRGGLCLALEYEANYKALSSHPGLFLRFAQMERTPRAVARFANDFGFLAHGAYETIALPSFQSDYVVAEIAPFTFESRMTHREWPKGLCPCRAESMAFWYAAMDDMRKAISLWDSAKSGSESATEKLRARINEALRSTKPELYFGEIGNALELIVSPGELLTALWLQLALAVDGRKAYRQCSTCQDWFEIGKWGSRGDKKFCGNSCRQAAYDARQKERRDRARASKTA